MIASLFILTLTLFPSLAAVQTTRDPGCITSTTPGDHTFTCENMPVYAIHGDGGTGPLQDAHLKLADLGEKDGYILLAPTGGGFPPADDALFRMVRLFADVLKVNPKKVQQRDSPRAADIAFQRALQSISRNTHTAARARMHSTGAKR